MITVPSFDETFEFISCGAVVDTCRVFAGVRNHCEGSVLVAKQNKSNSNLLEQGLLSDGPLLNTKLDKFELSVNLQKLRIESLILK
jgi:L-lactate utilization protein LutB